MLPATLSPHSSGMRCRGNSQLLGCLFDLEVGDDHSVVRMLCGKSLRNQTVQIFAGPNLIDSKQGIVAGAGVSPARSASEKRVLELAQGRKCSVIVDQVSDMRPKLTTSVTSFKPIGELLRITFSSH